MALVDYRLDPFLETLDIKEISGEKHTIPTNSPFTIRLIEVPQKTEPSTLRIILPDGTVMTEVAAQPAPGQYWPDYNTSPSGSEEWNTGTILFNAENAGKVVTVNYNGMGTLVDDRLMDMAEIEVTGSVQPERDAIVSSIVGTEDSTSKSGGSGNVTATRGRLKQHTGIGPGTYTLRKLLQNLVNLSHTQEFVKDTYITNCNCDCNCGDDSF